MLTFALLIAAAHDLAPGTYALSMTFVTEADAPLVGKVTTSTTSTALVTIREDNGRLLATQRACGMSTNGGLFALKAGRAFIEAFADATYEVSVVDGRFEADMGIASVAVDPKRRALPTRRDHFTDPDRDGRKGVPLDVDVGGMKLTLDVASLGHAILVGTVKNGRAHGKPRVLLAEQKILGGIPEMFAGGSKRIIESKGSFVLEPLRDGATCDVVERQSAVASTLTIDG